MRAPPPDEFSRADALAWTSVGWMLRARFRLEVEKKTQHTVFAVRLTLPG